MRRPPPRVVLRVLLFAAALALMIVLPHWLSSFRSFQFARAGVFFIAILGLNLLTGYTGQISLGHGAFMAIGGYTTAILVADHGVRDLWTIPIAGLVAGLAGLVVGIPALRLRGLYLALATFALAVALPSLLKKWEGLTGGNRGIDMFAKGLNHLTGAVKGEVTVLGHHFALNDWFYYLVWSIGAVLLVVAWLITRGRLGRAFRALRDSEIAAVSSGVNLAVYKTLAFAISGFYAGVAGSLFAIMAAFVNPQSFSFDLSIQLLVGTVVGGLGSLSGVVVGALFIEFLPVGIDALSGVDALPNWIQTQAKAPGVPSVVYGAAIVLIMFALPTGAGGLLQRLTSRLYTRS